MSTKCLLVVTLMVLASTAVAEDKPNETAGGNDAKVVQKLLEKISLCQHDRAEEVLEEALDAIFKETFQAFGESDPIEGRLTLMVQHYCQMTTVDLDDSVFEGSNQMPNKGQALDARIVEKIIQPTFRCGGGEMGEKILEKLVSRVIGVVPGERRITEMVRNYCKTVEKKEESTKTEL